MTVQQLIERLLTLDPDDEVGVHCHGCGPLAHEVKAVYAVPDPPVELWHYDADVIVEA